MFAADLAVNLYVFTWVLMKIQNERITKFSSARANTVERKAKELREEADAILTGIVKKKRGHARKVEALL